MVNAEYDSRQPVKQTASVVDDWLPFLDAFRTFCFESSQSVRDVFKVLSDAYLYQVGTKWLFDLDQFFGLVRFLVAPFGLPPTQALNFLT